MSRPDAPGRDLTSGGGRVAVKRPCNGCQRYVGDATDEEIAAVMQGRALPDVRDECRHCTPGGQT